MHGMGGGSLRTCTSLPDPGQQPATRKQCWLEVQIEGTVAVAQPEAAIVVRGFWPGRTSHEPEWVGGREALLRNRIQMYNPGQQMLLSGMSCAGGRALPRGCTPPPPEVRSADVP